jgi:Mg2+ and Co2+ transporter CorA
LSVLHLSILFSPQLYTDNEKVYNFMAQKNAEVNIAIARASTTIADESRRDAASMKTISILGMIFLPGAYIAAVFAMPVFDWDAAGNGPVTKKGFKLYWAVTIPVTLAVLMVWGLAMVFPWTTWAEKFRTRRERRLLWLRRALGGVEMGELRVP